MEIPSPEWIEDCRVQLERKPGKLELKNEQALVEYFLKHPIPDGNIPERAYKSIAEPEKHPRSQQISRFVRATENNLYATHDENEIFGALLKEACVFEHLCVLAHRTMI